MSGGEIRHEEARNLKVGNFILIDNEACKVIEITHSKPGKHGEAKYRIVAIGLFDDKKRDTIVPASHKVEAPVMNKSSAQILNIAGNKLQLMDMTTFETFEINKPEGVELKPGEEVMYISFGEKRKIIQK